jgi:hypothetical protein
LIKIKLIRALRSCITERCSAAGMSAKQPDLVRLKEAQRFTIVGFVAVWAFEKVYCFYLQPATEQ